jgi:hypothetical protein
MSLSPSRQKHINWNGIPAMIIAIDDQLNQGEGVFGGGGNFGRY